LSVDLRGEDETG